MDSPDGMSFSEFCYPVLQAYDWWHMFKFFDVQVQIGGADQYGNILTGMDGIKHAMKKPVDQVQNGATAKSHEHTLFDEAAQEILENQQKPKTPIGFTVPLLTNSSGEKFGKSAGNAIWLDKDRTSVFDLYGVSQVILS
jgi:tyrosyl-tRNA synthetase